MALPPENFKIIDVVDEDGHPHHASGTAQAEARANAGNLWQNAEFRKRIVSSAILAPVTLFPVALGGAWFFTLIIVLAVLMMREWDAMIRHREHASWSILGVVYVTGTCLSLVLLRDETLGGSLPLLLFLLAVVWATDTGAYFAGKQIGGPKLIPRLSPSKTWAGLFGGMLSAGAIGGLLAFFFHFPVTATQGLLIGAGLAIVAQIGDLFESWMKRQAGMKDSSNLIPGHGGILDRVDGLTFTAPLLLLLYYMLYVPPAATAS